MHVLGVFAQEHGHGEAWHGIVVPWMRQQAGFAMDIGVTDAHLRWTVVTETASDANGNGTAPRSARHLSVDSGAGSYPRAQEKLTASAIAAAAPAQESRDGPHARDREDTTFVELGLAAAAPDSEKQPEQPHLEDLVRGAVRRDVAWQFQPYDGGNATWQAAAQRWHQHRRRTNQLLGVASTDPSGPREPSPHCLQVARRQGAGVLEQRLRAALRRLWDTTHYRSWIRPVCRRGR